MVQVQSIAIGADPDISFVVFVDGIGIVVTEAGRIGGVMAEMAPGILFWPEN